MNFCSQQVVYHELFPKGNADQFSDHIFRLYDSDGNGLITFPEFITTLHVASRGTPEEKLRSMFRLYDIDRNGIVTYNELVQILKVKKRRHWTCVTVREVIVG